MHPTGSVRPVCAKTITFKNSNVFSGELEGVTHVMAAGPVGLQTVLQDNNE